MAADIIRHIFGVNQRPKLGQVPLSAPNRVRIVEIILGFSVLHRQLTDAPVVLRVIPVHIAGQTASQEGMVKSGIEFYLIILIVRFHANTSQVVFPRILRLHFSLVERQILRLGLQIEACVFNRGIRKADFSRNRFRFVHLERKIHP